MAKFCWMLAVTVLMLTGCTTAAQREQVRVARAQSDCKGFGFTPGTPTFSRCVMKSVLAARHRNALQYEGIYAQPFIIKSH